MLIKNNLDKNLYLKAKEEGFSDEKIIELNLSNNEKENFNSSIQAVKALFEAAKKINKDLKS